MNCPNCSSPMQVLNFDNEIVLHCSTCGSSFFDKGGIDAISKGSAQKLSEDAQGHYVLGNQKACPKEGSLLVQKTGAGMVKNTILLECPTCQGIFAYPDDLLKYKGVAQPKPLSASSLKLLPAPHTIFVLSLFAVLSLAVLLNFTTITKMISQGTKADEMIKKVVVAADEKKHYLYFDFITESAVTSQVTFVDKTANTQIIKKVSVEPKKVHHLTTTDLDLTHVIYYRIQLDGSNKLTEEKLLEIK